MSQPQDPGLRAQVLDVVPPGPIHRNRRSLVAKFSHRIPNFRDPGSSFSLSPDARAQAVVDQAARKKDETVSRLRSTAQQQQQQQQPQQPQQPQQRAANEIKVPLLLEQRAPAAGGAGAPVAVYRGVPEAGGGANVDGPPLHYILFRSGNRVTAFPADQWFGFKPHVDRRGLVDSVAAANAAAAAAGGGRNAGGGKDRAAVPGDPFAMRLVPKSQRLEKQRQDEEARERQEQVAAGRLLPLAGAVNEEFGGPGGGRLKRFVDEDELEAELFGDDEEEEAPKFGGKAGKGGKKGRGRGLKNADGEDLEEDEVPEDLYAGPAADEDLRPEKPEEAEDWEHEFEPDDDDQDQGADDNYDDDPGMRKKLGIEGDDEDEGEEADEQERKLKKLGDPDDSEEEEEERKKKEEEEAAKKQQAAAAAGAGGSAGGAGGGGGEEDEQEGEEDELDELDEMEEEEKPKPPPQARPPPVPTAAPKPAAAAAPAAVTGAKRKVMEEPRQPADGTKRARTATPPPPQAAAAAAAGAGAASGAAAAGGPKPAAAPAQPPAQRPAGPAGASGGSPGPAVTAEEVVELLRAQPNGIMPFTDFTRHFSKRTTTPELRNGLKSLTVSLCKSSKENGVLMVSLKTK